MDDDEDAGIKIVACGDGAIGKTSLLLSYRSGEFPQEHVPTIFENTTINRTLDINGEQCELSLDLWDTAGQEQFDRLRILAYKNVDVFLLCFSVVSIPSFSNLETKWIPEIKHHAPDALIILVGTKSDLKDQATDIVSDDRIKGYQTKCGAVAYVETSALTRYNVDLCFETAIRKFLEIGQTEKKSSGCSCVLL